MAMIAKNAFRLPCMNFPLPSLFSQTRLELGEKRLSHTFYSEWKFFTSVHLGLFFIYLDVSNRLAKKKMGYRFYAITN
jgi:hypothetical protein